MKRNKTLNLIIILIIIFVNTFPGFGKNDLKSQEASLSQSSVGSRVNFYFENSASMNGYVYGEDFVRTMHILIGRLQGENFNSYFVNAGEYHVNNLLNRIDNRNISMGDVSKSDHKFIFENAIRNAVDNNLSIVITDGIYSVNGKSPSIVADDIQIAFENALRDNSIETVILKLTSDFNGYYYSESCPPGKSAYHIHQKRPYYIFFFGDKNVIDQTLNSLKINELPGYKEKARFFLTDEIRTNYSIITKGSDIHGTIRPVPRFPTKGTEIHQIDAKRFENPGLFASTPPEQRYLQFGLAVNLSELSLPESYLEDTNNYSLNSDLTYRITEIRHQSITINGNDYTHVIILKGDTTIYGSLNIALENNLPAWIEQTGIDNDCQIKENESQTYAFDELMKGIFKAYQRINNSDIYTMFNLQINPL